MNNNIFKAKATFKFPEVKVDAELEEKTINPAITTQEVSPDEGYDGFSKVTVNKVDNTIDNNIKATNIKKGVIILGVTGSVEEDLPAQTKTVTPTTSSQNVTADSGYKLGSVTVNGVTNAIDSNIKAENIKLGVSILGVQGNLEEDKPDQTKEVTPTTSNQDVVADTGFELARVTVKGVTSAIDNNIQASNIKKDTTILGVTGTVEELNGQTTSVTPSSETQTITPDSNHNALTSVTVNPIPSEYIVPTGSIDITQSGTYSVDVTNYATANVDVAGGGDLSEYFASTRTLNSYGSNSTNGQWTKMVLKMPRTPAIIFTGNNAMYLFAGYKGEQLPNFTINGTLINVSSMFANCNYLTSIPTFSLGNTTNIDSIFTNCRALTEAPLLDTSRVTAFTYMFQYCYELVTVPQYDMSSCTNAESMFYNCSKLENVPELNLENCTTVQNMFYGCGKLKNMGGLKDLGKAYLTTSSANYSMYTLVMSATNMTEQSLINILNDLYDIASKGCNTQKVNIGSTGLAKLTSEEGQTALANAQAKGWTIA